MINTTLLTTLLRPSDFGPIMLLPAVATDCRQPCVAALGTVARPLEELSKYTGMFALLD